MEKVIVLETVDVVEDKLVLDSNLTVAKEEQIDQTPADVAEKEPSVDVEEVAAVVKEEESTDKEKDESGEEKVVEQVELNKEPTLVKEGVDEEKAEEKGAVKRVAEEDNKDKEEEKMVDVSESTYEAEGKQVESVDVQLVREVSAENVEVKPKQETSENIEAQSEKAKELAPEVEVVKAEETPETTEQAKVELVDSIVETKDSGINSKDEQTSTLCPEEIVLINQDSNTVPKKETVGEASSLPDIIEKAITEETVSETKDVVTKLTTETDPESTTEKVAEVVETATVVKESGEQKQELDVTTKEVAVKQKHSNSIISKVKQSLVKAKKAIIGKSPSSKTISSEEAKEEIKAK